MDEVQNNGQGCSCPCAGESASAPRNPARRNMLGWMVGIINAGVFGAVLAPTVGFIAAPLGLKRGTGQWVPVLAQEDLPEGVTKLVTFEVEVEDGYTSTTRKGSVYLQRQRGKVVAYDRTCPHLGCLVEFKDAKQRFLCPCHGGVFDAQGDVVSGPPPRGLSRLATRVEEGQIKILKV